ncbi:family 20 glycosylhydrolase [uncultured Paludibaculum sp.]|uniref:family 20 glycosylhydrolase n=1 Tax=uncultured Paludibaculum sp. TaxID=1765020 RepID=UPI002AAAB781|nr:family 20 glycosylhydrolase [uncultured Paludibaculum sp.]
MLIRLSAVLLTAATLLPAQDLPLLPQPHTVQLGSGSLKLLHPTIGFAAKPDKDDALVERALRAILQQSGIQPAASTTAPVILLERTSPQSSWQWDDTPGPNSSEAYSLKITTTRVHLKAATARGLFYAVQTLSQLLTPTATLRVLEIADWPAMRLRGFMLDLSHGPFPKFDELKRQIDFLARWKANQFYLYSETNVELDGFPLLSASARLTKAQVRELIAYAHDRFIDVVPCVELYGHLHDLARIETYSTLAEMPHGGEINPLNPKAQALIRDWVDQLTALFPSPWFHVGMDETYELGKVPGRQLEPAKAGEIYLRHFEQVSSLVAAKGKRVMIWGDILLQHSEVIARVPAGTVAIPWRYSDEPDYDRFVAPLAAAKVNSLLGSGVWNYYDAVPDFDHTLRNVDGLAKSARKHRSLGILHTEWTDCGQVLLRMADPAVAYGPIASWNHETLTHAQVYDRYARLLHPRHAAAVSRLLATVSQSQSALEKALGTRVFQTLWANPLEPRRLERARAHAAAIREARIQSESAQATLLTLLKDGPDPFYESLLYGARLLDYIALRQLYALEMDGFREALAKDPKPANYRLLFGVEISETDHSRLFDLMDAAGELRAQLRTLWLRDYLPYRLETAMGRWQGEFDRWRNLQEKIAHPARSYREGDPPPTMLP